MINDKKLDTCKTIFLIEFKDHPIITSKEVAISEKMNIKF
jgi:hypothetical protein